MNFDEIRLSRYELRALKRLARQHCVATPELKTSLTRLFRLGLIRYGFTPRPEIEQTIYIADLGTDYLAYIRSQGQTKRVESIRYWITTGIAVVALIKSFQPEIAEGLAWLSKLLAQ